MQTFFCNHCRIQCASVFAVFLHIFTEHMHTDIGLDPAESKGFLRQTRPHLVEAQCPN